MVNIIGTVIVIAGIATTVYSYKVMMKALKKE